MSRNPDPCYCEQAQAYEALLNRVLENSLNVKDARHSATFLKLWDELMYDIELTINEYKEAQEEYTSE